MSGGVVRGLDPRVAVVAGARAWRAIRSAGATLEDDVVEAVRDDAEVDVQDIARRVYLMASILGAMNIVNKVTQGEHK